jgi:hypothetical protein
LRCGAVLKFKPGTIEWRGVCTSHHNVLLEGPAAATDAILLIVEPHLREPVYWKRRGAPLTLPPGEVGALILQDVGDLGVEEQAKLLTWLDGTAIRRTQIVSTTAGPLFSLVKRGRFSASLYYRLNVMLLRGNVQ